jgi:putative oxidoreductase
MAVRMRRLFSQFLGGWRGIGLLFLRLVVGSAFILHGWQKIENPFHWMDTSPHPAPAFLQGMAVLAEVGGGAALILGLLIPIAALLLMGDMLYALAFVHLPHGDSFVATGRAVSSYERALVSLAVSFAVLLIGPGRFALDAMLFRTRDWVAEEKKDWLKIPA